MKLFLIGILLGLSLNAQSFKINPVTGKIDYISAPGVGSGDITGAQNAGVGTSIFYQKSGANLQFNGVKAASNKITVTLDAGTHDVTLDLTEANLTLANLGGSLAQSRITNLVSDLASKDAVLTFSAPLSRSTNTISIPVASSGANGYLSSTDWTTFNNKVGTARQIICGSTLTGCGDFSADRTIGVVNDTSQQRVAARKNSGSTVGTRQRFNFIEGANVTITVADDNTDNEVDVTIASSGAGGSSLCQVTDTGTHATLATPCAVTPNQVVSFVLSGNVKFMPTAGSGSGFIVFYDGAFRTYHDVTATCDSPMICQSGGATPPVGAILLAKATVISGAVTQVDILIPGSALNYSPIISNGRITFTIDSNGNYVPAVNMTDVILDTSTRIVMSCQDAGSTDSYACNLNPAITSYTTGAQYRVKINTANTGAATVNFNTVGSVAIKKMNNNLTTDLATGDLCAGQWVDLTYNGTNMMLDSPTCTPPSGSATESYPATQFRTTETKFIKGYNASIEYGTTNGWLISDQVQGGTGGTDASVEATNVWGGGHKFTTGNVSGNITGVRASNNHVAMEHSLNSALAGTQFIWEVGTDSSISAMRLQLRYLPGFISRVTAEPGASFGWMYDTANGTSGTNWLIQVCSATPTCTYTNTGVAVATNTNYQLVLTKVASGWDWSIRSGTSFTLAASGNFSPTIDSQGMAPVANIVTTDAANKSFTLFRHFARRGLY